VIKRVTYDIFSNKLETCLTINVCDINPMAHITDDGTMKLAFMKRIIVFQMILNFIELAMAIVSVDSAIQKIKDNYANMMDMSQINLDKLQGTSASNAGVTPTKRHKRPKTPEIPKFDVNKPGMQTFLNSMELLSQSYTFTDDKELAWFYLNNLTENSKTTIFSIYPLSDTAFYNTSNAVITYLKSFISPNIRVNALQDIRGLKMTENNGGLYAYYKSFNRLISELGAGALSSEVQVHYFIAGLNTNAVQNTNLNLHMHTFYENKPTSTVTDLYAEADKVISLSKTNSGNNGYGKRAGPGNRGTQSQQRDNRFKQQPYDGKTHPLGWGG
jgi:hypothetical protein